MKKLLTIGSFGAKVAIVLTATVGGTALVGSSVFASLTATANNTQAQSVTSGTLLLTQGASSTTGLTAGLTTAVTGVAPGDTINRFVDLKNTGTLAGASMTLGLKDAANTLLTSSATSGLQVVIKECSSPGGYTFSSNTASCATAETYVLGTATSTVAANTLLTSSPTIAVAAADLAAGATAHLRFVISLPTSNETTANGAITSTTTIEGLTSTLTWTFTEAQATNSNTVA